MSEAEKPMAVKNGDGRGFILIVEDDPATNSLEARRLEPLGIGLRSAYTAAQALEILKAGLPELMLVDYCLPDMSALELLEELKKCGIQPPPFVVITGQGDERVAVEIMKAGAEDYIIKDAALHENLLGCVKKALLNTGLRRELADATRLAGEERDKFKLLFESANDAVLVHGIGPDGLPAKFTEVNDAACARLGYTREELLKLGPPEITSPEMAEKRPRITAALERDGRATFESLHIAKDGHRIPVEVSSRIFSYRGAKFVLSISRNITERKQGEAALLEAKRSAETANSAKSEFLANMSHEIRTPINAILGMTELVLDTVLTGEQRRYLRTVKNSSNALLALVSGILDFSKIEAGLVELEDISYDLAETLEDAVELFGPEAAAKGVELVSRVSPSAPRRVRGDPNRIRQVLVNLVGNALKFTEKGQVVAGVERAAAPGGGALLQFSVADTGSGIPAEKRDDIFYKFSQADSSISRKFGGTGLGLSISKALVGLMGGSIWLESAEHKGSTFYFSLPLTETSAEGAAGPAPLPGAAQAQLLLADDSAVTRLVLKEMLSARGFPVREVSGGADALSALRGSPGEFKALIIEDQMPGLSGLAVIQALRADPVLKDAKVILLAAAGAVPPAALAEFGLGAVVLKPVRRAALLEAVAEILDLGGNRAAEAEPAAARSGREHLRILVAEDNPDNRELAVTLLAKTGYSVTVAANGLEAVEKVRSAHYDLMLMDIQMPELDGYSAAREIRRWEAAENVERTPIVALTANALSGDIEKALAAGMDDHLSKPVNRQKLIVAVEKWADHRSKVLLADDAPDGLTLLEVCLRKRKDIKSFLARDGREALAKFNRFSFSLVVTDMEMPELDGYAAVGLMRRSPGGAAVPIVALTAHYGAAAEKKCLDAGCNECLSKPVSMSRLLAIANKYVSPVELP